LLLLLWLKVDEVEGGAAEINLRGFFRGELLRIESNHLVQVGIHCGKLLILLKRGANAGAGHHDAQNV